MSDLHQADLLQDSCDDRAGRAGGVLTVDLSAIAANYRLLRDRVAPAECAAVVKADAYGLGAEAVAPALAAAGCRQFFVAELDEAIELRRHVPATASIAVLNGPMPGAEALFPAHDVIPVLNCLEQVEGWAAEAHRHGRRLPCLLQVDSGMTRFGLSERDVDRLLAGQDHLHALDLQGVISHLACADDAAHPANAAQLENFARLRARFPGLKASLAASSGIFLGKDYHFDLVRPGAALYGLAPQSGAANPMRPVVRLQGRVAQLRSVDAAAGVGYGHTTSVPAGIRLATVAVGYADGFLRSASNRGAGWFGAQRLPLVGRVSMDSIILDVSALAPDALRPGSLIDLIGPHHDLDAAARAAGTIGYEMLTSLGARLHRRYIGGFSNPNSV